LQGADHPIQGISARTIYGQVKAFFEGCSEAMRGLGDSKASERFAAASTHWLRHSHASHSIAKGVPIEMAQANLGHASLSTTTVYVTTESRRRMKAMGKFWG
jgi:integrase